VSKPVLVVILVLAAIVILFAVGIGAGIGGDQGSARDNRSGLLDRLGGVAGDAADADIASMKASCPGLDQSLPVLTFTGSCSLTVAKSGTRIRLVRLQSAQPLTVSAPAPEGDLDDIESDVDPQDVVKVAVGRNGAGDSTAKDEKGEIDIGCRAGIGTSCAVQVLNGR
jgi:hypothetical protein